MALWLNELRTGPGFRIIEWFNQGYPVRHAPKGFVRSLEIGAGLGEHLKYENLSREQLEHYVALDLRANIVEQLKITCPGIIAYQGDCQARLDFEDGHFDRIIAIHVLEHLPDLPRAVKEMHRLCNKERGVFSVVIPCEGGFAYWVARRISAQRIFESRYRQSYKWFIEREHLSSADEIIEVLGEYFTITNREYFPFIVPVTAMNLCIGLTLRPK